ncbi:MAG: hypothetical protein K9G76_05105 [Bacteroidales bacterium]|nr:hypothetical protein [Bacteroidales bacterium]MCF8403058.1 hypothetical protein [Bacteroidales bacterium]
MKKLISIIKITLLALVISSCAQKEKVDISQAPEEIKNALENSFQLSQELTDLQLKAGADMELDQAEIDHIVKSFARLAIVNNINLEKYATDKYFIALKKEYKPNFDKLAEEVVFLKDCKGYDEMGLAIQKIALEVKDVTVLPAAEPQMLDTTIVTDPL